MTDAENTGTETSLREQALEQVKKKRDFWTHVFIYSLVNAMLVGIWAVATPDSLFWPIFPILGWGIGLGANAWDVYFRRPITQEEVDREEQRLREKRIAG